MKTIALSGDDGDWFKKVLQQIKDGCEKHPCSVGGAEILIGAALIGVGIKTDAIQMGAQVVGVTGSHFNIHSLIGAGSGGLAGSATAIIGSIGVAGSGGAIAIPAALLGTMGAAVGAVSGYTAGDVLHKFLTHFPGILDFVAAGSLLAVGTLLIIDGCRRILGSKAFHQAWSHFKDSVLYLAELSVKVVCQTVEELSGFLRSLTVGDGISAAVGATAGAAIGSTVATSTITVLGSHALGGLALSLGIVSAPLWPVIACGAGGAALGYGVWKYFKSGPDNGSMPLLLNGPTIDI
jgi:hypothetical protein